MDVPTTAPLGTGPRTGFVQKIDGDAVLFHAAGWASRPITAYVDLAGELHAAFKSLRQRGRASLRVRAAGREDVASGTH